MRLLACAERLISIHVLRVEDDGVANSVFGKSQISIHVLRVEDDTHCHHLLVEI